MKFIDIALNDLKMTSRSVVPMILLVLMPILMISLMGNALKPVFESEKNIKKVTTAYVNEDNGVVGTAFDDYLKKYAGNYIELVPLSKDKAENYISSQKSNIAIVVPENLSEKFISGGKVSISVLSSGRDQIQSSVAQSVVNAFINSLNTQSNLVKVYKAYSTSNPDLMRLTDDEISKHVSSLTAKYSVDYTASNKSPVGNTSSFQYFAASMLLFFLLYTGIGIGSSILTDRADKTYMRINSFPVTDTQYLIGKMLGNATVSVAQALVVILFAKFAFGVNWGNIYGVAAVILLTMFISSASGILFSSFVGSAKSLSSALSILFWIIAFIGGGFSPMPALEPLGKYIFYKWALDSLSSFMSGGNFKNAGSSIILLLIFSMLIWALGLILYKRRVRYE